MIEYCYFNIPFYPDLISFNELEEMISGIHYDVANSEMTNKNIEYCNWIESEEKLCVYFSSSLSTEDKNLLDTIVFNNS